MSYQRPPVVSVDERYGCLVIVAEAGRLSGKRAYLCLCDCRWATQSEQVRNRRAA